MAENSNISRILVAVSILGLFSVANDGWELSRKIIDAGFTYSIMSDMLHLLQPILILVLVYLIHKQGQNYQARLIAENEHIEKSIALENERIEKNGAKENRRVELIHDLVGTLLLVMQDMAVQNDLRHKNTLLHVQESIKKLVQVINETPANKFLGAKININLSEKELPINRDAYSELLRQKIEKIENEFLGLKA